MNFKDSGLPQSKTVEDAFAYGAKDILITFDESVKDVEEQIKGIIAQHLQQLKAAKEAGKITEAIFDQNKAMLDKKLKEELAKAPGFVTRELNARFASQNVATAKRAAAATGTSDNLVAAALMMECMRSPVDHGIIAKAINVEVADMLSHIAHLEAYPTRRTEHLKTVSDDVKRLFLIGLTGSLLQLGEHAKKGAPIQLPPETATNVFRDVLSIWGVDKNLDARFTDVFNQTMTTLGTGYSIKTDAAGTPELVKGGLRPKGPRPPNNGNGGIGDSVF